MAHLKIAFLQLLPAGSVEGNIRRGIDALGRAAAMGADIALFPEMWSIGYDILNRPPEIWTAQASSFESFTGAFRAAAARLNMAVAVTFLEKWQGGPRNTLALFDRHGGTKLIYAKVHTCDFSAERALTPGDSFPVTELDTCKGPIKVGAMICYDREFPESARILMLKGAELILVPNACPMEINRLAQLRARAYENMLAIATCNYPAGVPDCNGRSTLFDGVAYMPDMPDSRDTCVMMAEEGEGIYTADLDMDMLRSYRAAEVHGNAYRRPEMYSLITDAGISPPFVRPDRRG